MNEGLDMELAMEDLQTRRELDERYTKSGFGDAPRPQLASHPEQDSDTHALPLTTSEPGIAREDAG